MYRPHVAATLARGASVSVAARQYDVDANQVFGWRRHYREAEKPLAAPPSTSGLVPVTITQPENVGAASPTSETIEIEIGGDCRVRVGLDFPGFSGERKQPSESISLR